MDRIAMIKTVPSLLVNLPKVSFSARVRGMGRAVCSKVNRFLLAVLAAAPP